MEFILITITLIFICLALNIYAIRSGSSRQDKAKPEASPDPGTQKQLFYFSLQYQEDDLITIRTDQFTFEPGDEIIINIKISAD